MLQRMSKSSSFETFDFQPGLSLSGLAPISWTPKLKRYERLEVLHAVPVEDTATGSLNNRNHRQIIVWLSTSGYDHVHETRCEPRVGIPITALAAGACQSACDRRLLIQKPH